jgi:hypothetical protein
LFPYDIDPYYTKQSPDFTVNISIPKGKGPNDDKHNLNIRLVNRTVVDNMLLLNNNNKDNTTTRDTSTCHSINDLKEFNRHLLKWKQYGQKQCIGKFMNKTTNRSTATANASLSSSLFDQWQSKDYNNNDNNSNKNNTRQERTYLFVPLNKSTNSANDDNDKLSIDWNTIFCEIYHTPIQVLSTRHCNYNIPVIGLIDSRNLGTIIILLALVIIPKSPLHIITIYCNKNNNDNNNNYIDTILIFVAIFTLLVGVIIVALPSIVRPKQIVSVNQLQNHFILHRGIIYQTIRCAEECIRNALSSFANSVVDDTVIPNDDNMIKRRPEYSTYQDYFLKRYVQ